MRPVKLDSVASEGPHVTEIDMSQNYSKEEISKKCLNGGCKKNNVEMFRCKRCHSGCFCSKKCQKECWQEHKVLCDYIVELETLLTDQVSAKLHFISKSSLSAKEEVKLVKLVGRKCTVDCYLNGKKTKVLWDTGAEVALISRSWLERNFPDEELKDVSELLGHQLFLKVANNSNLNYLGYVEIVFKLSEDAEPLKVPFLVTEDEVSSGV